MDQVKGSTNKIISGVGVCAAALLVSTAAFAQGNVTFTDVAQAPGVGLDSYHRTPSSRAVLLEQFLQESLSEPLVTADVIKTPMRPRGVPGVAVFDYDNDGDLDLYVTNGPGTPNSLFQNQLADSGAVSFIDVAAAAGVEATMRDSNGVCYGDIDNDGDEDFMIVNHESAPILYENNGNGQFQDISQHARVDSGVYGMSCVMGDINNDGRLDIFVARGYSLNTLYECFLDVFSEDIQANDLYLNRGNNRFRDVSDSSGIRDLVAGGMPANANTITWSAALVDYDQDGDLDLFTTDDQCNYPGPKFGSFARGTIQLFKNDGRGNFENATLAAGLGLASEWMGTSWGDFNNDGVLDFFVTSFGDWGKQFVGAPIALGDETSRWYIGDGNGGFIDPGVGSLLYTPFGWGTIAEDLDNDGDTDIAFYGGLDMLTLVDKSNPGAILLNDGWANFAYDPGAVSASHMRRNDSGVAAGDIDGDGFVDIVSVSNFDAPAPLPLVPFTVGGIDYNSPWDPAFFVPVMNENNGEFTWNGIAFPDGTVALELNNGESGYESVEVEVLGTKGILGGAKNNRDGIGAVITFTPHRGKSAMKPVLGGSSHASQNSLQQYFGMGEATRGTLDILWPGGVRNRMYNVQAGDKIVFPEIPCSYADTRMHESSYVHCVQRSVNKLERKGYIDTQTKHKILTSAVRAYRNP